MYSDTMFVVLSLTVAIKYERLQKYGFQWKGSNSFLKFVLIYLEDADLYAFTSFDKLIWGGASNKICI